MSLRACAISRRSPPVIAERWRSIDWCDTIRFKFGWFLFYFIEEVRETRENVEAASYYEALAALGGRDEPRCGAAENIAIAKALRPKIPPSVRNGAFNG